MLCVCGKRVAFTFDVELGSQPSFRAPPGRSCCPRAQGHVLGKNPQTAQTLNHRPR